MITLFKANPKNKGASAHFKTNVEGEGFKKKISLYISFSKQLTWNSNAKTGTFSKEKNNPNEYAIVKYSETEIGSIISALKDRENFSYYHTSNDGSTKGGLKYTEREFKGSLVKGFILSVSKNSGEVISVGIQLGEAELLIAYLTQSLQDYYRELARDYAKNAKSSFEENKYAYKKKRKEVDEDSIEEEGNPLDGLISSQEEEDYDEEDHIFG